MKQRNLFSLYLARTVGMLSGARRVALLLLLTLLTTATAWAQTYTLESGTLTISGSGTITETGVKGACGNDKSLIKEVIIGAGVTGIGQFAFADCSQLTSVTIGPDVTTIDYWAFQYCSQLTSVTIGSSLTPETFDSEHANGAFAECAELTEFIVPAGHQSFTSIDGVLYCDEGKTLFLCPPAKTSCTIPDGVTTIADYAFAGTKITSLTMPNSVTTLGNYAFGGCPFTEVTLSNSITTCGEYIFYQCSNLKTVTIPEGVKDLGSGRTFAGCTSLESVTLPSSLTSIPIYAFITCENLQSVTINDGVSEISEAAFARCTSLKSVNIPNSVTTIGPSAFYECQQLETLPIYNGVTTINISAFGSCCGLTSLVIPSSVTEIRDEAFKNCNNITTLTIGSGVKKIGGDVFKFWGDNVVVYCFADPSQLDWNGGGFNANTTFHVYNADDWTTKFTTAQVQFVGDLFTLKGAYLPKTGTHAATIPSGVKTLKVYDDGGEDDLYSNDCDGSFTLTAPTGYKLQVSGNMTVDTNDKLTVYDGADATADKLLDGVSSSSDGTETAITPVQSTGESLTINFTADADKRYSGLDLTVTVGHTITIASGITEGTITADKALASDGETVTLTITPNTGYVLNTVSYNDTVITPVNGAYTFTMPAADVTITATFKSIELSMDEIEELENLALDEKMQDVVKDGRLKMTVTPKNKYWTLACGVDLLLPKGVVVYKARMNSAGTKVELTEIDATTLGGVLKANNGVLIASTPGESYDLVVSPNNSVTTLSNVDAKSYGNDNELEPVLEETHFTTEDYFILMENKFVMVDVSKDTKVPAGKAVLKVPAGSVKSRSMDIDGDETTGIHAGMMNAEEEIWYNLQGQRISKPTRKGVYILNGKKVRK